MKNHIHLEEGKMKIADKIIGKIIKTDKCSKNQEEESWIVEFDGGYNISLDVPAGTNRNKVMMLARNKQSEENRYNFDARRASGGRILKAYKARK